MNPEESKISKAEQLKEAKKGAVTYLKARAEELETTMARNFVNKSYALASHDARQLADIMAVLGQIDLNS